MIKKFTIAVAVLAIAAALGLKLMVPPQQPLPSRNYSPTTLLTYYFSPE
jgi:hypothetical protein